MLLKLSLTAFLTSFVVLTYADSETPSPLPTSINIYEYTPFGIKLGDKFDNITYANHRESKDIKIQAPKPSHELFDSYSIRVNSKDDVYQVTASGYYGKGSSRNFSCKDAKEFLKEQISTRYPYLKSHDILDVFHETKKDSVNNLFSLDISISIDCMGDDLYLDYKSIKLEKIRYFNAEDFKNIKPTL